MSDTSAIKITETQMRQSVYSAAIMALFLPPFFGSTVLGLIGFFPMPEVYTAFQNSPSGPYVLITTPLILALLPLASRFITELPKLPKVVAQQNAERIFSRFPYYLFGFVIFYALIGTAFGALTMENLGLRQYTLGDHLNLQLAMLPLTLMGIFPIYFYFVNRLGRYLGPRGIVVPVFKLRTKLLMLGIVTPLLVDSLLIGYYYNRTGYFQLETLLLWLGLIIVALLSTRTVWRSLHQSISPLESVISEHTVTSTRGRLNDLMPVSLDEMGVLTTRINDLLVEQKKLELELRVAATSFDAQESIIITDENFAIMRVNQALVESTGFAASELLGQSPFIFLSNNRSRSDYCDIVKLLKQSGSWQGELYAKRKHGKDYPVWFSVTGVKDNDGYTTHFVGSFMDITERKLAEEKIRYLAFFDQLTKMPNRQLLMDRLQQALLASARSHRYGALLFIDLDKFKDLNDTLGHQIGDELLCQVASRLKSCIRESDTVARLGGDEFVAILPDLHEISIYAAAQAEFIGEKILLAFNEPFGVENKAYRCTTSIGATLFRDQGQPQEELIKQADIAMYHAKKAGRNTLRFFDPTMQENVTTRVVMEAELHKALENKQFQMFYQIQTNTSNSNFGAEALIRWNHPERGLISPNEFVPLLEETGLIVPVGFWVLDTVCAQLKAWAAMPATRDLVVAMNISAKQFHQQDFIVRVKAFIEKYRIDPGQLKFEITESLFQEDVDRTRLVMMKLRKMGVKFSLDDFGTGYSSLQYLKKLPLDQLKIDRSFVQDIASDNRDIAVIRATIAMAKGLELDVIAEGVETDEQKKVLIDNGCQNFQGYLFGKPLPLVEFETQLIASV